MKRFSRRISSRFILLLLFATMLSAYALLQPQRRWPNGGVNYTVDNRGIAGLNDGDGGVSYTVAAITSTNAWNGVGVGTVVSASGGSVAGWRLGDGTPMLNFRDPENACTSNCLAATFTGYYNSSTGYITDADIVTNSAGFSFTTQGEHPNNSGCNNQYYLESVMTHEVGHGLGLDHSSVSSATMYPYINACDNSVKATTSSDDNAGLQALYSCTPYGYLCDPRYTSGVVCCPGRTCRSPYPGVPQYCL